jgi:hypothetical protein
MNIENKDVIRFWKWFQSIATELFQNPTRADLIGQIDSRIARLGRFDWEVGPFEHGTSFFCVSPNLDISRLEITNHIIALAPICDNWIFLPSKPPKNEWKGLWKMDNNLGREIIIDASNWEYILYQFEDTSFDMDIKVDEIDGSLETYKLAVDIALTGYLGEEVVMRSIPNVTIVDELEDEAKATKLRFIKKHMEGL